MKLFRGDVIVEKRRDIGGMTKDEIGRAHV